MQALRKRFRVLRELAGPRVAAVFEAEDLVLGGRVAVKSLPIDHDHADELRDEALRHASLRHPRLVPLVARFEDCEGFDGKQVVGLATRWVDGQPLGQWAASRPDAERLRALVAMIEVVEWLHRRRWLHLDIKPDNVVGTVDGPVLLDMGTARPVSSGTRSAGGTVGYAAPEVVRGEAPAEASDLFSLGVLMFVVLGGRLDESMAQDISVRGRALPSLRGSRPDLPRNLVDLVDRMCSPAARERPISCADVLVSMAKLGVPLPARTPADLGEPAFIGRSALLESLVDRLQNGGDAPLVIVGERGAGRMRLAHEILAQMPAGKSALNLDLSAAPGLYLQRLLGRAGAPGNGDLHDPRLPPWLRRGRRFSGLLLLGRMEEWDDGLRRSLPSLAGDLSASGLTVVACAKTLIPALSPVGLRPLSVPELRSVANEAGLDTYKQLDDALAQAGGRPGLMLRTLLVPPPAIGDLPDWLKDAVEALRWLPVPVPPEVIPALPDSLREAWHALEQRGLAERRGSSWIHLLPLADSATPSVHATEVARTLLQSLGGLSAAWRARWAARVGLIDEASTWLAGVSPGLRRDPTVVEVATRLAHQGDDWGAFLAGFGAVAAGELDTAAQMAARIPVDSPLYARLNCSVLGASTSGTEPIDFLEDWISTHADDPETRGLFIYFCGLRGGPGRAKAEAEKASLEPTISQDWRWSRMGVAARFSLAVDDVRAGVPPAALLTLMAEVRSRSPSLDEVDPLHLWWLRFSARALEDRPQALALARSLVRWADRIGDLQRAAEARLSLGAELHDFSKAEEARRVYFEALSLYERLQDLNGQLRVTASVAEIEIHTGRLAAAEVLLRRFEEIKDQLPHSHEADVRGRVLWAGYHAARDRPEQVLHLLEDVADLDKLPPFVRMYRKLYLAEAYVDLSAHAQALALLETLEDTVFPILNQRISLAKGRAHVGIGRGHLASAAPDIERDPDPLEKETFGMALLAAGGEDLDPASFAQRRLQLGRATELLEGDRRVRAAAIRDRLLEGPGAALDQIVRLVEAIGQGPKLLEVVAQVVADALGAHRVLVMLRLPGLGRQLTAKEISGQESAGLAPEIWRRVRRVDDVWLAEDAFADPNLRRLSATVRTFQVKSVVAVAIPKNGEVIGALYVDDIHRAGRFGPADVGVLQRIARAIGDVAEALPAAPPSDGLTVHDLQGMYTCDDALAARSRLVFERVRTMRQSNMLLTGPTGAGKTWMAKRIATEILGAKGLVEVVLRPGPTEMLVSQLWGTRPGDFTGSVARKGAIFQAWNDNAVLFLDELQNLDEGGQRVLLPLLELPHRRFGSLTGGVTDLERPLHIILGTNALVDDNSWAGTFREDLWWRVSPVRIDLPPLSKRGREAVYRHLEDMLRELGLPAPEEVFERAALQRLATHTWPGNLRSLGDLAERAAMQYRRTMERIPAAALPTLGLDRPAADYSQLAPTPSAHPLVSAQARTVLEVLGRHEYVQSSAAAELGMSKFALHRLLKRLDLLDHIRDRRNAARR